jgi:hypothetical protein
MHEAHGADHRGNGQPFADQHHGLDVVAMEDVRGDHQQHRGRGDTDQEREVGDVEAPGHLVAHARDHQSLADLAR